LPGGLGRKMLIQLNKPGLEALVEIVRRFEPVGAPSDLSPCSGARVTPRASEKLLCFRTTAVAIAVLNGQSSPGG
jgi:hypothetical protein